MQLSKLWEQRGLDLVAIGLASFIAYAASLRGYFLSDDFNVVTLLNAERTGVDWPNVLSDFYTVFRGDLTHSYYRPMITLSGAIDYSLWGTNPFGGHLTNLFFNMINGILVYGIAAALPPSPIRGFALLAGLLFALHPLHSEPVYWLVGRTELIMASFTLLSILLYLVSVNRGRRIWQLLSISAFVLALGSKETAIAVPFALTLHLPCFSPRASERSPYRVVARLAPYYVVLGLYFVVRKAITGHFIGQYGATGLKPFVPSLIPKGIVYLLLHQLRPTTGQLFPPAADALAGQGIGRLLDPLAWILVLAIAGLVIVARMDRFAWFCLGLTVVLGLPLLSLLAVLTPPRLHYLPSAAFCLFLAALLVKASVPVGRVLGSIVFFCFAALLALNSLPWIHAGHITREIVQKIERAANTPGVEKVVITGNPDVYFGAELFGDKSWSLQVAAAPPFAKIPVGVRIINLPRTLCGQSLAGILQGNEGTMVLQWEPHRRSFEELPPDRFHEICGGPHVIRVSVSYSQRSLDALASFNPNVAVDLIH